MVSGKGLLSLVERSHHLAGYDLLLFVNVKERRSEGSLVSLLGRASVPPWTLPLGHINPNH